MSTAYLSTSENTLLVNWTFDGDYLLVIEVKANGYSGHAGGHVIQKQFLDFKKDLKSLQQEKKGEATISSLVPGEFSLTFKSKDTLGHLVVLGKLFFDYEVNSCELSFSFEIDPQCLNEFIEELNA